jgi:inorganic pyrophosphatase
MADPVPQWSPFARLEAYDEEADHYNVVIETPRGSRHKYTYREDLGLFALSGVLPAGAVFPFDFGFLPSTLGGDGDPLDVLVLLEDTAFTGCLVPSRLLGVIEAEQTERAGESVRNDRLIAVAAQSYNYEDVHDLEQLSGSLLKEIEHFFVSYNQIKGKKFTPLGRSGRARARQLVQKGIEQCQRSR